jgi:hypothetical protein
MHLTYDVKTNFVNSNNSRITTQKIDCFLEVTPKITTQSAQTI